MEGEHTNRPIKRIIYAHSRVSQAEIRGSLPGRKFLGMTVQVKCSAHCMGRGQVSTQFRCVTIKAVGGSRDQINDVINSIKYHCGCQQCGRIPPGNRERETGAYPLPVVLLLLFYSVPENPPAFFLQPSSVIYFYFFRTDE